MLYPFFMTSKKEHLAQLVGYREDLTRLEAKAAEMDVERDELRKEIEHTKRIIASIASLVGESGAVSEMGFTDACRLMLNNAHPEWISGLEIREALSRAGFDLTGYANAMASIYTILRRLEEADEIEKKEEDGKTLFRFKPEMIATGGSVRRVNVNEDVIAKAAATSVVSRRLRGRFSGTRFSRKD
jgi:hypothetical protein